jgi:hypothetical protein
MNDWSAFFQGELSAAAALSGLLFVALSVNQKRILELGRTADRGAEALIMLLLVIIVTSLGLIPGQPPRLLGCEILALGMAAVYAIRRLQRSYLANHAHHHANRTKCLVAVNNLSVGLITIAGLVLLLTRNSAGLYILSPGILVSFVAVGTNAWVLLIEINR